MEELHTAVRAWAKGIYPLEAGAELLCRTQWAGRLDRGGWVEWSDNPRRMYAHPRAGEFLVHAGYLSGGERRQLTVIASFLGQLASDGSTTALDDYPPYDLQMYEALPGVDQSFIRLVQSAVGHAAGLHEHGGNPLPWPDDE